MTPEEMTAVMEAYCHTQRTKDKAGWLALFAPDIVHEDPVGGHVSTGLTELAAFWDRFQPGNVSARLTAPLIVCGNEAIVFLSAEAGPDGARKTIEPIVDNVVFNAEGKITRARAFYNRG
ncbi:MAG: nuclear transport factor 2 family protein [Alphaproteobacteria bacterium]|nr:nuclear transport factor 2 family protein [Alphaproteobacteria bacterium]